VASQSCKDVSRLAFGIRTPNHGAFAGRREATKKRIRINDPLSSHGQLAKGQKTGHHVFDFYRVA
jgi:hypothetical protein